MSPIPPACRKEMNLGMGHFGLPAGAANVCLGAPFRQIQAVFFGPAIAIRNAPALMGDADRPDTEREALLARRAAEIDVVEVKVEPRVEADPMRHERGFSSRKQHSIQQFALRGAGAVVPDLAEGLRAMRH